MVRGAFFVLWLWIGLLTPWLTEGQSCYTEAKTLATKDALKQRIIADSNQQLLRLQPLIPGMLIDLRYGTTNNITHTVLYRHPYACMRRLPALALRDVQQELRQQGLGLKVYDAFRPFSTTCTLWRVATDRHYVANPRKGSNHNRGLAVDATLVDLKTGKELEMGTGYDNFTDTAHHGFGQLPSQVLKNRKLLKAVMRKHGFGHVPAEWWHYQWRNDRDYEVLDMDFDELKDMVR